MLATYTTASSAFWLAVCLFTTAVALVGWGLSVLLNRFVSALLYTAVTILSLWGVIFLVVRIAHYGYVS